MSPIIRNIMAIVGGIAIGMLVNMALVTISTSVIPLPEGIDPTNTESMKENVHLLKPANFIFPFLAHALGTLIGAFVAAKFSGSHPNRCALLVGLFFLLGGIAASMMIPAPTWFVALDLIGAYIPMAFLGSKMAGRETSVNL